MTIKDAKALQQRWFGTARKRKPPTDAQLKDILQVTRSEWDESIRSLEREESKTLQICVTKRKGSV